MEAPPKIRVGICGCTDLYRNELQGKDIQMGEVPEQGFGVPDFLFLQEQEIPEEDQRRALQQLRPHFFIDAHPYSRQGEYFVRLEPNHMVVRKKGPRLNRIVNQTQRWNGVPPSAEEMTNAIRQIVHTLKRRMSRKKWEAWLSM